eukprot:TRINITY_DN12859_c1_g5_i1.p1 TRINITY_DN12859_c1_g5~~TRINITY_DN12859_c1_g5_i1.p1  ORF type:complete len:332 (+),score=53.86 TRINITY_DN12859_c1_g5_i1:62-1057(+)
MATPHPLLCPKGWEESTEKAVFLLREFYHTMAADGVEVGSSVPERGWGDVRIFLIYAMAMFIINWGVRFALVMPLGKLLLRRQGKPAKKSHVEKFSQAAMEALFYGVFMVMGYRLIPKQEFAWPSSQWWAYKQQSGPSYMTNDIICFYIGYCARYVQGGISVLMEHKRKDFLEMQIHHWVTAVLVGISYIDDWMKVGVIVMLLLDPADVPLHTAKMFKYVSESGTAGSKKRTVNQFFADRIFESFAVVFLVTRIVFLPYVVYSATFEARALIVPSVPYHTCILLLWIIQGLQIYWMSLIVKAVYNMILKGGIEDIRSDSEDEDEGEKPKKE